MGKFITYKTSSPSGDLISFLSGIRQMWLSSGKKAIIYHRLGMIGNSYEGSQHPYENEQRLPVCFNQYTFDMMRPLLLSQPYVEDYLVFTGQEHDVDLDKVRLETFTNQPRGSLNRWAGYVFPEMITDLSKAWIDTPMRTPYEWSEKVVINFTSRHRNTFVNYFFLKQYQQQILFAGLPEEHKAFCKEWDLDIQLIEVNDFYSLASAINHCKFFLGNQSFCFQLAEAVKCPRILEVFPLMPNVIPCGENSFDYYHQNALEYLFTKLLNAK